VLTGPVENRTSRALMHLRAEIRRETGVALSKSRLSVPLREKEGSARAAFATC
jgi:hypothetical protein